METEEPLKPGRGDIAPQVDESDGVLEVEDDEDDDLEARGLDDDSGYGPDSNFAHSMGKDD